jgi:hypothetical protein
MTIADRPAMTPDQADHWHEGYRTGRRAAAYALRSAARQAGSDAESAALDAAATLVEAIPTPECSVVMPRADRLASTIHAALSLNRNGMAAEATACLEAAIR